MTQLAAVSSVSFIALDSSYVYWIDAWSNLKRVPIGGGTSQVLRLNPLVHDGLAVDATSVYWGEFSVINKASLGGGAPTQLVNGLPVYGLAIDASYVYWSTYAPGPIGLILKAAK